MRPGAENQKDQDGTQAHARAHDAADSSQTVAIMFILRVKLHPLPLTAPFTVGIGRRKFCQVMICHIAFPLKKKKRKIAPVFFATG